MKKDPPMLRQAARSCQDSEEFRWLFDEREILGAFGGSATRWGQHAGVGEEFSQESVSTSSRDIAGSTESAHELVDVEDPGTAESSALEESVGVYTVAH